MKQRISSVFLALVILLSMLPSTVFAAQDTPAAFSAEVVDSGTCGENLTWTLDNSGTLTISGEGPMENYYFNPPWNDQRESIKRVVIEEGVTSIGTAAFFNYTSLKKFVVAEGNTCYTAKEGVLFNKDMSDIVLCPAGKTGRYVIPNGVTSIGEDAFYGCAGLTSVKIPDSVTSIGDGAFERCTGLTSVVIPNSVTAIGTIAFSRCSGLTKAVVSDNVTEMRDVFSYCTSLTSVTLPKRLTSIGDNTFACCTSITSIKIPDGVKSIGQYAFDRCAALTQIYIPAGVTTIGKFAFADCTSLKEIAVAEENVNFTAKQGVLFNKNITKVICCPAGKSGNYTIPSGVTDIEDGAFDGCQNLKEVVIPGSVTSIGGGAFIECKSLTEITIPASVTSIESGAFMGCKSLTEITIPHGVESMGMSILAGCDSLVSVTIPNSVTSIGEYAFSGCKSLREVTIPNSVTDIEWDAFNDCVSLTSVRIPRSMKSIGVNAFKGCTVLTDVYYDGTKEQWKAIDIKEGNKALKNAVIHYNSTGKFTAPTVKPDYLLSTGKPYLKWKTVDGAVKYEVYRSGSKSGTYQYIGTTTKLSYTDTTAKPGYYYNYKVKAVNAGGVGSNASAAVTALCHCARPVLNSAQYLSSSGKPYLSWGAVTGAGKYYVYRAGSQNGSYKYIGSTTKTNYTDTTASAGYTYYYKVKAVSKVKTAANSAYSAVVKAVSHCARPVVKPDYLASTGKPYLKWSAVTGASKYEVYRAGSQNGTYKYIGSTTKTGYTDTNASAGYAYYYKVKAISNVKSTANSSYSTVVKATCHCAKPVVKITTSSGKPKLTWNAVAGAGKYEVYRATSKNGTYTKMFTTTNRSYTNTNARAGTTYYYKVKAISRVRSTANSSFSAIKSIRAR